MLAIVIVLSPRDLHDGLSGTLPTRALVLGRLAGHVFSVYVVWDVLLHACSVHLLKLCHSC